jgi:hypothetical protein
MRPCRIQSSGVVIAMTMLLLGTSFLSPMRSSAQCGGTLGSITYDTSYSGSVSSSFSYTLPQFSLSASTLYAVTFKSVVSANAAVEVFNASPSTIPNPLVSLFRTDGFTSTVTGNLSSSMVVPSSPVAGPPLASFASELIPMPNVVNNQLLVNDSLTPASTPDFSGFTGAGTIPFTYSTNNIALPQNAGTFATSTSVTDNINFSITYYYCTPPLLATDIITFTAIRENDQTVLLGWVSANEQAGRTYHIEVSSDGAHFTDAGSVPSDPVNSQSSYSYNYTIPASASGKLYFQLKMVDDNGAGTYSPIRVIDLGAGGIAGFSIYPNPPSGDFINLLFPPAGQGWQVDVLAADGRLIQRNIFSNAPSALLNFNRRLAPGTYFARATEIQTASSHTLPFVIR